MNARELRIGNWVNYKDCTGKLFEAQVTEIREDYAKCGYWHVDSQIPLTEEWLLKFGCDYLEGGRCILELNGNRFLVLVLVDRAHPSIIANSKEHWQNGCYYSITPPEHVHQLQNLYYALTGKELEINTKPT